MQNRYKTHDGKVCIELNLRVIQQLFDMRDPAPFRDRDLDDDAASYILSAVREFPLKTPLKLIIYFAEEQPGGVDESSIRAAVHNHFAHEATLAHRMLKSLFRDGEASLAIGSAFLAVCISLAGLLFRGTPSLFERVLGEGLLIIGWVAMWRPLDVFLYGWWPLLRQKRYLNKLANLEIELTSS